MNRLLFLSLGFALFAVPGPRVIAAQPYAAWAHTGDIALLTTPDGAGLPESAVLEHFPALIRLHQDGFDFSQAAAHGEDVRFTDATGTPLAYQIDEWDTAGGRAAIWVRIPLIRGNARQIIHLHWGRPGATSESNPKAVFSGSNGYLGVWHLGDDLKDEAGALESKDTGTTGTAGVIGRARHFDGNHGIACGGNITGYPTGASPHTTEAWFRAEKVNGRVIAWGNEKAQGKVVVQFASPPHIRTDCYFSNGNLVGGSTLPMGEWVHVALSYQSGDTRLYVNGALDATNTAKGSPLNLQSPAKLWLGGWQDRYDFAGEIDEARLSKVARSAEWVRLAFENQKPMQSFAGHVVQPGSGFAVSPAQLTLDEGQSATFTATAGGAQKISWSLVRDGREWPLATDRFKITFDAGRTTGDTTATLRFKAVFDREVRTKDVALTIKEAIPEPRFTLAAPATWDGRSPLEIVPRIENLAEMQAKGAGDLKTEWSIGPIAVTKNIRPDRLVLTRAEKSGLLTVKATLRNGGEPTTQMATIRVSEPPQDAWIARAPEHDEKPEDGQFFARDDKNEGTLFYRGTLEEAADAVFLKVYADDRLYRSESARVGADKAYAFSVNLKPGLIRYRAEFGSGTGANEKVLHSVANLVCGDAYLIDGQSNAVATDWGREEPPDFHSPWIRSFGSTSSNAKGERIWGEAVYRSRDGGRLQVGYWAMELGKRLVESQKIPVCLINGAVGGTRIDQHQRNPENPEDMTTIYGRLLWRVRQARLTHGIRAVIWHQGENDQGADGPTGGYGWETYRQFFIDLAAAWKQDYPNIRHTYLFQIWPKACAMGINGSDNRLREVQRTLPTAFSRLSIMSTLGIDPPGGCHYPPAGYAEIARLIAPLIERDHYGKTFAAPITPPNLVRAFFTDASRGEVALEFDQPVKWDESLAGQFHLDGEPGKVASGSVAGSTVKLRLAGPSSAKTITYLDSANWNPKILLRGENGIAALTFCEVPLLPAPAAP